MFSPCMLRITSSQVDISLSRAPDNLSSSRSSYVKCTLRLDSEEAQLMKGPSAGLNPGHPSASTLNHEDQVTGLDRKIQNGRDHLQCDVSPTSHRSQCNDSKVMPLTTTFAMLETHEVRNSSATKAGKKALAAGSTQRPSLSSILSAEAPVIVTHPLKLLSSYCEVLGEQICISVVIVSP